MITDIVEEMRADRALQNKRLARETRWIVVSVTVGLAAASGAGFAFGYYFPFPTNPPPPTEWRIVVRLFPRVVAPAPVTKGAD